MPLLKKPYFKLFGGRKSAHEHLQNLSVCLNIRDKLVKGLNLSVEEEKNIKTLNFVQLKIYIAYRVIHLSHKQCSAWYWSLIRSDFRCIFFFSSSIFGFILKLVFLNDYYFNVVKQNLNILQSSSRWTCLSE